MRPAIRNAVIRWMPFAEQLLRLKRSLAIASDINSRLGEYEAFLLAPRVAALLSRLQPFTALNLKLIRLGKPGDGGYIMHEDFGEIDAAYSMGIANDVSWDAEIARRGKPVYMYDHTIPGLPAEHEQFHFNRVGISDTYSESPPLRPIPFLLAANGHQEANNLLMKMDIEGHEWAALDVLSEKEIRQFSQISLELHDLDKLFTIEGFVRMSRVLMKLTEHMHVVHIHANNVGWVCERYGVRVPVLLEVTFVRRDRLEQPIPARGLSVELDQENDPNRPKLDISSLWLQRGPDL